MKKKGGPRFTALDALRVTHAIEWFWAERNVAFSSPPGSVRDVDRVFAEHDRLLRLHGLRGER
jgi:hypothetical protein